MFVTDENVELEIHGWLMQQQYQDFYAERAFLTRTNMGYIHMKANGHLYREINVLF